MALKKIFKNDKGITTEYHMIAGLKVTDRIEVVLKSYTDESYRQLEKDILENIAKKAELEQQLLEESVKEEPNEEVLASISLQMAALDIEQKDYSVGTINYRIPFSKEDDISFSSIYEKLKTEATFADAEDC